MSAKLLRYPGTKPFETHQQKIFKGRDADIANFYQLIKLEQLVVLHSKSGMGKSSLLNAGIIPLVQQKRLDSVRIRFKSFISDKDSKSPLTITQVSIRKQSEPIPTFLDDIIKNEASIWHDIKEHQIVNRRDKDLLLIFDQFEELFTYPKNEVAEFAENLAEILLGSIPQRYWDAMETLSDQGFELEVNDLDLFQSDFKLKIILSIRSDQLHLLDQIKDQLPSIHQYTYVLGPLTREGATAAIVEPAGLSGDYITPVFEYEEEALEQVLDFLSHDGKEEIESAQLQIICESLEKKAHQDGSHMVRVQHTNDLKLIVENYYEEKIEVIPAELRDNVRKMIQEGLVFAEDGSQRRLSLFKGVIDNDFGVSEKTLNMLVDSHLLRRELVRGDYIYELSHDSLLSPVIKARDIRREEERKVEQEKQLNELREEERRKIAVEQQKRKIRLRNLRRTALAIMLSILIFAIYASITNLNLKKARNEAIESKFANYNFLLANKLSNDNPSVSLRILDYVNKQFDIKLQKEYNTALDQIYSDTMNGYYSSVIEDHSEAIVALDFSPIVDMRLATGSRDRSAKLWNMKGSSKQLMISLKEFDEYINALKFLNNNGILVASGNSLYRVDGIFSHQEPKLIGQHKDQIFGLDVSDDNNLIVTGGRDNVAKIWTEGNEPIDLSHPNVVETISINNERRLIATGCWDSYVRIWSFNGEKIHQWKAHNSHVYGVKFSNDGNFLVSGSRDNTAKLWSVGSYKEVARFDGHDGSIYSVDISPNGTRILTGSRDKTARLWDIKGNQIRVYRGHKDVIYVVAFSKDGKKIATGSKDNTVRIWKTRPVEEPMFSRPHSDAVYTAQFSPDGDHIITGGRDFSAIMWSLKGDPKNEFKGHKDAVTAISFSASGDTILTTSWDDTAHIWSLLEKAATYGFEPIEKGIIKHTDMINAGCFSKDGNYVATAGKDKIINIWTNEGIFHASITGHTSDITSLVFSQDNKYILSGSRDNTARLTEISSPSKTTPLIFKHDKPVNAVAISASNQYLLTGSTDKTATLWNFHGDSIRSFQGHHGWVSAVAFSPDDSMVLTGSRDDTARLWSIDGVLLRKLGGHTGFISSVSFSPDGQYILTSSWDNTARLWGVNSAPIVTYGKQNNPPILDLSIMTQNESIDPIMLDKFVDSISTEELISFGLIPTQTMIQELKASVKGIKTPTLQDTLNINILMRIAMNFEGLDDTVSASSIWDMLWQLPINLINEDHFLTVSRKWFDCNRSNKDFEKLLKSLKNPAHIRYYMEYLEDMNNNYVIKLKEKLNRIDTSANNWIESSNEPLK